LIKNQKPYEHDASLAKGVVMITRLLFSNVPVDCSDDLLKKWIEDRGYLVSSVRLIQDAVSRTSPSFAHVQLMASAKLDEAERMLNGQILQGRLIHVRRVVPPPVVAEHAISAGLNPPKTASA
jgi:hypothetical protein